VADINQGAVGLGVFEIFPIGAGRALFTVNDGTNGFEPWISDGTAEGTSLVADINPGPSSSFAGVGGFANLGEGRILFAASGGTGYQLWITDGFEYGTYVAADLSSASNSSFPGDFFSLGDGEHYFHSLMVAAGANSG
jgi:ELWxxDGT repeat protein